MKNELGIKDARKLAKYYGRLVQCDNNIDDYEALHYCRWIILKRRIKNEK